MNTNNYQEVLATYPRPKPVLPHILMTCQSGLDDHNYQGQAEGQAIMSPGNV